MTAHPSISPSLHFFRLSCRRIMKIKSKCHINETSKNNKDYNSPDVILFENATPTFYSCNTTYPVQQKQDGLSCNAFITTTH